MTVRNTGELEKAIREKQEELVRIKEELTALRKQYPTEQVEDYELTKPDGTKVKLSELFGDKSELFVIHNMGEGCKYCTLWADGLNGFTPHIQNRAAFVLTSPDAPDVLADFADSRGWMFPCVSTAGTTFKEDLGFRTNGQNMPGVSVLIKDEAGTITHYTKSGFDPGDEYCSIWPLFDLLPEGSGDWAPQFWY